MLGLYRLGKDVETVTPLARFCQQVYRGCLTGKKYESAVGNDFANPDSCFYPVYARHDYVAKDDVGA